MAEPGRSEGANIESPTLRRASEFIAAVGQDPELTRLRGLGLRIDTLPPDSMRMILMGEAEEKYPLITKQAQEALLHDTAETLGDMEAGASYTAVILRAKGEELDQSAQLVVDRLALASDGMRRQHLSRRIVYPGLKLKLPGLKLPPASQVPEAENFSVYAFFPTPNDVGTPR